MEHSFNEVRIIHSYPYRQRTAQEGRYHSYELKALAVVDSVERFRTYLIGRTFKVVTDCIALKTSMTKRDILSGIGRW